MKHNEWFKYHEGWIAALMVAIGAFSLGILCTVIIEGNNYANQMKEMSISYNKMLDQKDQIIAKLSATAVTSATNSLKASDAAQTAVKQIKVINEAHYKDKENNNGH